MRSRKKLDWHAFWSSPQGRTVLSWERAAFAFCGSRELGDTAVQVGSSALDALENCSIAHRILVTENFHADNSNGSRQIVVGLPNALPLAGDCADYVVWPHGFNTCAQSAAVLADIYRALTPNGLLAVTFFNSLGPWSLRSRLPGLAPIFPKDMHAMSLIQAKRAMVRAGFTLHGGFFGVYAINPAATGKKAPNLLPTNWDKAGDRWWPTFCNVVLLLARKRVGEARMVGKLNFARQGTRITPAPIAQKAATAPSSELLKIREEHA